MIACTFCAGCTDNPGGGTPIIGTSAEQKEFDEWMNILENPPSEYIAYTGELRLYKFSMPEFNLLRITYMTETNKVLGVFPELASPKLYPVKNGAKLDNSFAEDVFIIEDSTLSTSTVTALQNKGTGVTEFAVLHLTSEEYDAFVQTINDWFKKHHS